MTEWNACKLFNQMFYVILVNVVLQIVLLMIDDGIQYGDCLVCR